MLYTTTCVGLRYGSQLGSTLSGFSREHDYLHCRHCPEAGAYCRISDRRAYFTTSLDSYLPSTGASGSPRQFHFSVTASLQEGVTEC